MKQHILSLAIATALFSTSSIAKEADEVVEQITIFGSSKAVDTAAGSGAFISKESLEDYAITDIQRVLSSTPGVYFVEEDGYGLRPNIGMRGSSSDRSEKVTIMEDGVLAAPAPYASPAAYYFPTVGRMESVEVLKGGSSIKYGPRTSGGVINLVSSSIPDAPQGGKLDASVGADGFRKVHAIAGGKQETIGAMLEVFNYASDGFKDINSGQNSGFSKTDVMGKIDFFVDSAKRHQFEVKLKYADESSDETYVGITYDDFVAQPYQRYAATQLDNMSTEHKHASVHYDFFITDNLDLSVIAYHNDFARNWYKVSKIGGKSLGSGAEQLASEFDANREIASAPNEALAVDIKANNRDYLAQGIQAQLGWISGAHEWQVGARVHNDEMDRFQWVDSYALQSDLSMQAISAGVPGTDSNRIESANAISAFVQDTFTSGDMVITAGVRYENVNLARDDWGTSDPLRMQTPSLRRNEVSALLPSVGFTYQLNDEWLVLAGAQKAFAPPSPGNNNAENEEGWNYEAGARFSYAQIQGEVIAFVTQLDNLHGNCTASQGCNDALIGQQYNAGKVDINGLEFLLSHQVKLGDIVIPTRFNYTVSNAEFKQSFASELDLWGSVEAGFELPYLPKHTWQLESGLEGKNWQILAAIKYTGDMRVIAGNDAITLENGVQSRTIVDLSANYEIDEKQSVYAVLDNLMDKEYIATRQHGGIQVGKPRSLQVGYRYQF